MGRFLITIDGTGNHGCMRELGDGDTVVGCDRPGCVDCMARELVRRLKRSGATLETASLRHWPGTDSEVGDDLLTGKRTGSF